MIETRKKQFEDLLIRKSEIDFNDYYKEKEELFTGVARTYGNKQARRMRNEHKKEFTDASKKQAEIRKDKLNEISKEIDNLDDLINENKKIVENKYLPTLNAISSEINKCTNEISEINLELKEIKDAEKEINIQMRKIENEKRKAISGTLEEI